MQTAPQQEDTPPPPARGPLVVGVCATLLVAFAVTSWSAARTKCATIDEPLHSIGGYLLTRYSDYRVNPEDPPLWQRWASLTEPRDALKVNRDDPQFVHTLDNYNLRIPWLLGTFYSTPGNDADAFVMRQRTMLILLGVALGALIGWWAWKLRGAVAAVAAVTLFAFDPNFLAHAALVKNDVAMSLASLALAYATWRAGARLTWANAAAVAVLAGVALVTKFSGPLVVCALVALLILRALLPQPWVCFGRTIRSRAGRLGVALALGLAAAVVSYVVIWANYSFRYAPSPDGATWKLDLLLQDTAIMDIEAHHPGRKGATRGEVAAWRPPAWVRTVLSLESHRVLPQSYLYGMLYTYGSAQEREAFLCGRIYTTGSVAYFPLAFVFKTPLATQALLLLGAVATVAALAKRRREDEGASTSGTGVPSAWTLACLWVPFAIYAAAALTSRMNIGLRHILPLYPILFVAAGCGAAGVWRRGGRIGRLALAVLAVGLAAETIAAFPNYIPFFNSACGGSRGGLALLGDSNLDWGQDLRLLADWQKRNPDRKLYLCYFGAADPLYYGIRYTPLPGTMVPRDKASHPAFPREPGVIAISATPLQGLYQNPRERQIYGTLRDQQAPLAVLGGSIYLYEYNPE